jgi:hypothetical protein
MRRFVLSVLVCGCAASASALTPSTGNVFRPEQKPAQGEYQNPTGRIMGDTVMDPFIIGALPFSGAGSTVGFANDYDAVCPYSGSTAPDVVYKYVPTASTRITVDLCASTYDTKVYIFANAVGNVVACNDDWCAYQSFVSNVPVTAGNTYYIVVDGYGSSAGSYYIDVSEYMCSGYVPCPDGAMLEGEPDCYDGYIDTYNGGCNATPFPVFQILEPAGEDITICGTTGVYEFGTQLYRDTDWYQLDIAETSNICLSGDAAVPCYFFIIDGRGGCEAPPVVAYGVAGPCLFVSDICHTCAPGTWWAWVGPDAWDASYGCGDTYYVTISGYDGGCSPAESTTWGSVKSLFR